MSVVLGIDFGTSNSACCCLDDQGHPKPQNIKGEEVNVPSIVVLDEAATYWGKAAELVISDQARQAVQSRNFKDFRNLLPKVFREFKRRLGSRRMTWKLAGGRVVRPVDLVASFIRHLLDGGGLMDGKKAISSLCLTHPVGFNSEQLLDLREALYRNGFCREIKLLPEPVAAAMGYEAKHGWLAQKKGIVVFDFGGGTLDVAYLMRDSSGKLVARSENCKGQKLQLGENIGGADIDMLIYSIAAKRIGRDPDAPIDPDLKMKCKKIKEGLSLRDQCQEMVFQTKVTKKNGVAVETTQEVPFSITRDEFMNALKRDVRILPGLKRTLKSVLDAVKEDRQLPPVDCLLPIGGSCRMPAVQELLNQMKPQEAKMGELFTDDIAVAMGASIEAGRHAPVEQLARMKRELEQWVKGVVAATGC